MRGLLAAVAALACLPGAAQAQGALGANFNEHYEDVDYRDLERADARWVRLFVPMPQLDRGVADHGAVKAILDALAQTHYNRTAAAKLLGITFRALRYRMERLGINDELESKG